MAYPSSPHKIKAILQNDPPVTSHHESSIPQPCEVTHGSMVVSLS